MKYNNEGLMAKTAIFALSLALGASTQASTSMTTSADDLYNDGPQSDQALLIAPEAFESSARNENAALQQAGNTPIETAYDSETPSIASGKLISSSKTKTKKVQN